MSRSRSWIGVWCALAIVLGSGCNGDVEGTTGGGLCDGRCDVLVQCSAQMKCDGVEPTAVKQACLDSCEGGLDAVPSGELASVKSCLQCIAEANQPECNPAFDYISDCEVCRKVVGGKWTNSDGMKAWEKAEQEAFSKADLVCGNGRSLSNPVYCDPKNGFNGSTNTDHCSFECGDGPDVAAACEGPAGAALTCECTAGKNQGNTFMTKCDDLFGPDFIWNECNL